MKKILVLASVFLLPFALTTLSAETDKQFVQSDEVFLGDGAFTDQDWMYTYLAKELKAASKDTKYETQVQTYADNKTQWTKNAWKTKIATAKDLKEGALVICLDARDADDVYRVPANRAEALDSYWFIARITDLSDLFKDIVTVSGGYRVNKAAVRIVLVP